MNAARPVPRDPGPELLALRPGTGSGAAPGWTGLRRKRTWRLGRAGRGRVCVRVVMLGEGGGGRGNTEKY